MACKNRTVGLTLAMRVVGTMLYTYRLVGRYTGRVTRHCALVIKVGVVYVNEYVLRNSKQELAWAIDKWLRVISITMSVIPLRI